MMKAKNTQEEFFEKVLSDFLNSLGEWARHLIIGGGFAPIIYKMYLSKKNSLPMPVGTRDIDTLVPRKLKTSKEKNNICEELTKSGFEAVMRDLDNPPTEAYIKKIDGEEIEVEFLTDKMVRNKKNENVRISGVSAQPLSYLELGFKSFHEFYTKSKVRGLVVGPGAWIFHKGLTFPRRQGESKLLKDLYGIWFVGTQLEDVSHEAVDELRVHMKKNPSWARTWKRNLSKWFESASPELFTKLEQQDPSGKLKHESFYRWFKEFIEA